MVKLIILIGGILIGFWGTVSVLAYTARPSAEILSPTPVITPQMSVTPFTLNPPEKSLKGSINLVAGTARIEKRGSDAPIEIVGNESIVDGEAISTAEKSNVVVSFENGIQIGLESGSRISFTNTLDNAFLIEQTTGSVIYKSDSSLSVRNGVVLTSITGEVMLTYLPDEAFIEFESREGSAVMSWVNNEGGTEVYEIPENTAGEFDIANDEITLEE